MPTIPARLTGHDAALFTNKLTNELSAIYAAAALDLEKTLASATATDFAKFRAGELLRHVKQTRMALDAAALGRLNALLHPAAECLFPMKMK